MSRRIFPCQTDQIFTKPRADWNWGQGRKLFLPAAFFSLFRLAVTRVNPTGRKRSSAYESVNSAKKLQNVYCFGGDVGLLGPLPGGASSCPAAGRGVRRRQHG